MKSGEDLHPGILGVALKGSDIYSNPAEIAACQPKSPAYKAGLKAGDRIETSIVIVSDLKISVQVTNDSVRVYATNRKTGEPVDEVFVKVSDGKRIRAQGFTDARGVFEGRGVKGAVMVVAEKAGDSALYRK